MKTLLVPTDPNGHMPAVVDTALLFASRFQSVVEGIALRPMHVEIVAPDPIVAVTFPPADWNEGEFARKAAQRFEALMQERGCGELGRAGGASGASWRWHGGGAVDDGNIGSLSRVYDLTVVGRPAASGVGPRMTTLEAVLFESGRPILIAPSKALKTLGETVVIAWNCSTETARTVGFAMPVLKLAKRVFVLTIDTVTVPGPSGKELARQLELHGIPVSEVMAPLKGRKSGEAMLGEAMALGGDLMIKGAYTQSRLRQMIFGGATSHILAATELPVFMAH